MLLQITDGIKFDFFKKKILMIFDKSDQCALAAEIQSTLLYARVVLQTCCYHVRIGLIEKNPSSMHSEQSSNMSTKVFFKLSNSSMQYILIGILCQIIQSKISMKKNSKYPISIPFISTLIFLKFQSVNKENNVTKLVLPIGNFALLNFYCLVFFC